MITGASGARLLEPFTDDRQVRACQKTTLLLIVFLQALMAVPNTRNENPFIDRASASLDRMR